MTATRRCTTAATSAARSDTGRGRAGAVYPCPMAARNQLTQRLGSTSRTAAQVRTLNVAMRLFTEHGVGATSYQMIADALGVTKGAIYHQFKTKDEIIIAVAEMELAKLEDALEAAEAIDNPLKARELLL